MEQDLKQKEFEEQIARNEEMKDMIRIQELERNKRKNVMRALLSSRDRQDLTESIQNLKYHDETIKDRKNTGGDNTLTGCISIKDQVLRQLQKSRVVDSKSDEKEK